MTTKVLAEIDRALDESLKRLFALMQIPSISTDPTYAKECRKAAEWLAKDLTSIGLYRVGALNIWPSGRCRPS